MFTKYSIIVWLCCLLSPFMANAIEIKGLYQDSVTVSDQSLASRKVAYKEALSNVLIRVSGSLDIIKSPAIKKVLSKSTKYLSRYQYVTRDGIELIEVYFNANAINQVLRDNGYAIWGARRPLISTWIAVQRGGDRQILSEQHSLNYTDIQPLAKKRGLPVLLPLMDFEDANNLSVSDIWGGFDDVMWQASQRYQPDLVAYIKLQQVDPAEVSLRMNEDVSDVTRYTNDEFFFQDETLLDENSEQVEETHFNDALGEEPVVEKKWYIQMSVIGGDKVHSFEQADASDMPTAIAQGINWLGDLLAKQYAVAANSISIDDQQLEVTFANTHAISTIIQIESFLQSLSAVSSVQIKQKDQDGVSYQIKLIGEAIDLLNALELDERVEKIKFEFAEDSPKPYYFSWKG
ncbi:DUF2066 domain-containing protein [Catenovulum sp. SM1970]|uniref:DUF2066 domain-containing protein n=1 Tax=Marinifaba aquimaris TaxID=2741323 RepID=UPI001571B9D5|nr:DUF2066 domain-containing protein [Marinifaba aquimaris]NTS76062.1 DUF2066 domain-containing protein [Marinifaba aquimaris]